jgi:cell division protein ZipA
MDATTLRIILAVVGALVLGLIWWTGRRPAPPQGRRVVARSSGERAEPQIGAVRDPDHDALDPELAAELDRLGREIKGDDEAPSLRAEPRIDAAPAQAELAIEWPGATGQAAEAAKPPAAYVESNVGARVSDKADRIVTVYVSAGDDQTFAGCDIIVALEKTGLAYGALGAFHRLPASPSEFGAVFSVVNMMRPGRFDMTQIQALRTQGLSLFMVLPNALSALDAWDAMLPTAQRLAELLNGQVLDEERNALGRQRIQHIRDELRAYDRAQEKNTIRKTW